MLKKLTPAFVIALLILLPGSVKGFVPEAPHLLHLVIEKIRKPVGLEARQVKNVLNYEDPVKGSDQIEERLIYSFPGRLRVEALSDQSSGFSIENETGFVKVMDSQVMAEAKSPVDFYTDILLYRDYESMLSHLERAGIDTTKVSFQRYNDAICYVIGTPEAGLWIEKESFFPLKYVIRQQGWTVEFFYENWQKVSRTWYPMAGSIFLDNQLIATISVKYFELKSIKSDSLFDVEYTRSMFMKNMIDETGTEPSEVDELDRSIDDFKKLYE